MRPIYTIVLMFIFIGELVQCKQSKCTIKLDLEVCYSTEQANVTKIGCVQQDICRKQVKISYVTLEPYSYEIVADLLRTCCGPCINVSEVNVLTKISQIPPPTTNNISHFVFPVLGRANAFKVFGYYFIPLIETRSIFYITHKADDLINQLITSCINMWPLVIICLLMVMISGFIGWIMETWDNKEHFPRPFMEGWFEGFWWSFISMTTVGYGDKVPKSIAARLFSVVWIFIGITTFSLVTAMLSSEITAANTLAPPTMLGSKVGAIRHRLYEAIVTAKHGGILIDIQPMNVPDGVRDLIIMLKNKEINGFVLDRYTLLLLYRHFENIDIYKDVIEFLKTRTIQTEMSYMRDEFSYGILVKDKEDYTFLSEFVMGNRDVLNTCNDLLINKYSSEVRVEPIKNPLFSTSGKVFLPTVIALSIIITLITCYGILYDIRRRRTRYR